LALGSSIPKASARCAVAISTLYKKAKLGLIISHKKAITTLSAQGILTYRWSCTMSKFNMPAFINTPLFLYQDNRLDKPATNIASFFYSLHISGKSITASTDYLCELACIKKRQLYNILNMLEEFNYIKRVGLTNRRQINWIYSPTSTIIIEENDTNALQCTTDTKLNTSALECTQLVHSSALNLCTPLHTDNKVDNKEDNKDLIYLDLKKNKKKLAPITDLKPVEFEETYFKSKQEVADKKQEQKMINEILENNPFQINELLIRTWYTNQIKKNKVITSGNWALMLQDCYKYKESGLDPIEAFEIMVKKGWDSLNLKQALAFKQKNGDKNSIGYINSGFLNRGGL
jgi:hypothetical protein